MAEGSGALCFVFAVLTRAEGAPVAGADAGRRVVGFGVGQDGGEFGAEEFGGVVPGAQHGRADGHRSHG